MTTGMTAPKRKCKPLAQYRSSPEEIAEIDAAIKAIVEEERATISPTLRLSVRHIFYRVEMMGLVPKTDEAIREKEWKHPGQWTPAGSRIVQRRRPPHGPHPGG
jgi:hypothetical protein